MSSKQDTILVVDDERSVTDLLSEDLADEGYNCVTAFTGEDALKRLSMDSFEMVLLDLKLPGISGMDVLKEIKSTHPGSAVIVVSASRDVKTAVEAMKIGAADYITKPFELERVNSCIEAVLKARAVWSSRTTPKEVGVEEGGEEVEWTRYLDDIAEGVETRLDWLTGHIMTTTIIETTTVIARRLSIPEEQIEKWVDTKRKHIQRINILDSLVEKVEKSSVA